MKNNLKIIIATALLAFCATSQAEVHNKGIYAEANVGTLYSSVTIFGFQLSQFGSLGLNTNVGYQFSPNLATEIGYSTYGYSLNNVDAALKVILPFRLSNNDFTVFAKIGPALVFNNHESSIIPFAGIGSSYSISKNVDATLQAQGVTQGIFSLGLISLGLTYHFD